MNPMSSFAERLLGLFASVAFAAAGVWLAVSEGALLLAILSGALSAACLFGAWRSDRRFKVVMCVGCALCFGLTAVWSTIEGVIGFPSRLGNGPLVHRDASPALFWILVLGTAALCIVFVRWALADLRRMRRIRSR